MNLLPRDYTTQENTIAKCLDEFGLRYDMQVEYYPYTVDFYIPELFMVVEADGKHGHLSKRDAKRDAYLLELDDIKHVIHVKELSKERIRETLWLELDKLKNP